MLINQGPWLYGEVWAYLQGTNSSSVVKSCPRLGGQNIAPGWGVSARFYLKPLLVYYFGLLTDMEAHLSLQGREGRGERGNSVSLGRYLSVESED